MTLYRLERGGEGGGDEGARNPRPLHAAKWSLSFRSLQPKLSSNILTK